MSQVVEAPEALEPAAADVPFRPADVRGNEFDYRPVPVIAVVGCVLGVLSIIAFLGLTGILLSMVALLVSGFALVRILLARGELGGRLVAGTGLALALLFGCAGTGYQSYLYGTELPEGFRRISFTEDISRKGIAALSGGIAIHPEVEALEGEEIFVKGFMYPPPNNQSSGIGSFLLVKDSGTCCFGGQPALQDMIGVVMQGGKTVDFYQGRISVAGTFELNRHYTGQSELEPVFLLKGEIVSKSKTAF